MKNPHRFEGPQYKSDSGILDWTKPKEIIKKNDLSVGSLHSNSLFQALTY